MNPVSRIRTWWHGRKASPPQSLTVDQLSHMQDGMVYLVSARFPTLNGWFYIKSVYVDPYSGRLAFVLQNLTNDYVLNELDFSPVADVTYAFRSNPFSADSEV